MEHVAAIMLLLACSDDLARCEENPAPTIAYETVEACESAIGTAVRDIALDAPTVLARCFEVDPSLFAEDVEISWTITETGELDAELALVNPVVSDTLYADASAYSVSLTDAIFTVEDVASAKEDRLGARKSPDDERFGL